MARKLEWKWEWLVPVYRMVRAGLSDSDVCKTLKISRETFYKYQRIVPELKAAIALAEKERIDNQDLPAWVNARLGPELMALWKKIEKWDGSKDGSGVNKIEMLLQDHGKRVRQQLFLHALCVFQFDPSTALRKVNVTARELKRWIAGDVEFAELVEEIEWHKGNFFESSLVQLVQEGNAAATIFANRAFNSGRGYGVKDRLDVNIDAKMMVGVVDLAELMPFMSDQTKTEVLEAIRKKELEDNKAPTIVGRIQNEIQELAGRAE